MAHYQEITQRNTYVARIVPLDQRSWVLNRNGGKDPFIFIPIPNNDYLKNITYDCCLVEGGYGYKNGKRYVAYVGKVVRKRVAYIGAFYTPDWHDRVGLHYMQGWNSYHFWREYFGRIPKDAFVVHDKLSHVYIMRIVISDSQYAKRGKNTPTPRSNGTGPQIRTPSSGSHHLSKPSCSNIQVTNNVNCVNITKKSGLKDGVGWQKVKKKRRRKHKNAIIGGMKALESINIIPRKTFIYASRNDKRQLPSKRSKYGMPVKILKAVANEIAGPLIHIINLMFVMGSALKYGVVRAIYKKGSEDQIVPVGILENEDHIEFKWPGYFKLHRLDLEHVEILCVAGDLPVKMLSWNAIGPDFEAGLLNLKRKCCLVRGGLVVSIENRVTELYIGKRIFNYTLHLGFVLQRQTSANEGVGLFVMDGDNYVRVPYDFQVLTYDCYHFWRQYFGRIPRDALAVPVKMLKMYIVRIVISDANYAKIVPVGIMENDDHIEFKWPLHFQLNRLDLDYVEILCVVPDMPVKMLDWKGIGGDFETGLFKLKSKCCLVKGGLVVGTEDYVTELYIGKRIFNFTLHIGFILDKQTKAHEGKGLFIMDGYDSVRIPYDFLVLTYDCEGFVEPYEFRY
ncbi:hypothetical protein HHI36_004145 [Cryptolaemus montrouzieri]|uniref:Uncharacterized protein n=1 Tax=Cryptolaemus montrouzieri TaxID=559131 RepID=A0ABD2NQC0_9CUCU